MNEIGIALVWCAAQVTLIGVLAAVVYGVARRIGPAAGSLVVITSLLVVAALSALAFSPWPHWPVVVSTASSEHVSPQPGHEATPAAADSASDPASAERAGSEQISGAPDLRGANQAAPTAVLWQALLDELSAGSPPSEVPQRRWTTIVAILFFVAAGAGFLWVVAGLVAVRSYRLRSRQVRDADLLELVDLLRAELGCRRPIELREADGLVTATTFGWRSPVILLPTEWTDWTQAERRAVLAHEIAHVRHNDFLACLGGQLGLALHFYHPLVHRLVGRLRLEQELAADATAAALAGGKGLYLRTLAEIALRQEDRFVAWPARTFLPTRNTFLRRIQMLRHSKHSTTSLSTRARVLMAGVLVLSGLMVAGLRRPARDPSVLAADTPQTDTPRAAEKTALDLSCVSAEALSSARGAAGEAVSINNLKQLALAMLMYCETHGSYPPAASYGADGKPLLSWRVHLLPFLGAENVYRQFRLDEPWDSPHNVKLLPKMPAVYRHPADTEPGKHYSSYYVLAGPGTVFAFKKGVGLSEIRDGTSNTILLVEAQRKVPWTKPDDIPYEPGKPLPKLGGFDKDSFRAALCDGSVRSFKHSTEERVLRALIEKADGQVVNAGALE